jgi:hypothetical protein
MWFLSFFGSDPKEVAGRMEELEIDPRLKEVIERMTAVNVSERLSADAAATKVEEVARA